MKGPKGTGSAKESYEEREWNLAM